MTMAICAEHTDPVTMSAEERLAEIAAILAEALSFLRSSHSLPVSLESPHPPSDCGRIALTEARLLALMDKEVNTGGERENGRIE
jgi:hypothetical protein